MKAFHLPTTGSLGALRSGKPAAGFAANLLFRRAPAPEGGGWVPYAPHARNDGRAKIRDLRRKDGPQCNLMKIFDYFPQLRSRRRHDRARFAPAPRWNMSEISDIFSPPRGESGDDRRAERRAATEIDAFGALANPLRRELLLALRSGPRTASELCAGLAVARSSASEHLQALRLSGLVQVERRGREQIYHLDPRPLNGGRVVARISCCPPGRGDSRRSGR